MRKYLWGLLIVAVVGACYFALAPKDDPGPQPSTPLPGAAAGPGGVLRMQG